jgi:hypothetical protein
MLVSFEHRRQISNKTVGPQGRLGICRPDFAEARATTGSIHAPPVLH